MVALGGAALMLWFRDQGWHWAGGLIAALAFSYGASMAWRIQHIGQVLSLAYLPIALLCLDRALARGSIVYGVAAGVVGGRHRAGARPGGAAGDLSAGGLRRLAHLGGGPAASPPCARSLLPLGGRCGVCALAIVRRTRAADRRCWPQESNRAAIDYIGAGARLAASGPAADPGDAGRVRRLGPHGGLLGAAELRLARYGPVHRPEHGPALHRRHPAPAAAAGRRARPAVGARDPLLHRAPQLSCCSMRSAGTRRCSAASTRCCPASASTAGRPTRRSWSARSARSWPAMPRIGCSRHRSRTVAPAGPAIVGGDRRWRWLPACSIVLGLWLGRLPRLPLPLGAAALSFAAAALALGLGDAAHRRQAAAGGGHARRRHDRRPRLQQRPQLAPRPSRPRIYEVLEPDTRNATIAILKSKVVADDTRRDRIELAGLGFHWPNASLTHSLENTLGYNPVRLALYSAGDRRRGPRRPARPAPVLAAVSLLPLDAGQPAGPALHRHRRADRDHRSPS